MPNDPESTPAQSLAIANIGAEPNLRSGGVFEVPALFDQAQRVALCMCSSTMVPERYQGEKNVGNAMIAIDIAYRLQLPALMVMQHLYVVYGTPSWSGQMVIALVNGSKMFTGPLEFEYRSEKGKDDWGCRAYATLKHNGEKVIGPWVDIAMAKAEGWYDRKDREGKQFVSKWRTIPELMMTYRAAAYFGRTRCPEVTIGLRTREEEEDTPPIPAHGPLIELEKPSLGENAAQPAAAATPPPAGASLGAAPGRRTKKKETAAAPATPPAAAPPEPEPEKPAEPQAPAAAPPAEPAPPAAPPPPAKTLAVQLAEWLATNGIAVDDFFDWIDSAGWAQIYHISVDTVQSLEELPEKMITDLLANEKVKAGIVKTFGKK